nr:hypothetical protein CFP56_22987 [Quercus suber]
MNGPGFVVSSSYAICVLHLCIACEHDTSTIFIMNKFHDGANPPPSNPKFSLPIPVASASCPPFTSAMWMPSYLVSAKISVMGQVKVSHREA